MQVYKKNISTLSVTGISLLIFLLQAIGNMANAQNYSKQVKAIVKDAKQMEKNGGAIALIADKYVIAAELKPGDPEVNFAAGKYLLSTTNRHRALRYLKRVDQIDPNFDELLGFYIGLAYKHNMEFDEAIQAFETIMGEDGSVPGLVRRQIDECKVGRSILKKAATFEVWNAGVQVNSPYPDYAPTVDSRGGIMVFTSRRFDNGNASDLFSDGLPYEEIYYSLSSDGKWGRAENIGTPINSRLHDSNLALSPDGNTMLTYSGMNEGDILISYKNEDGIWSRPVSMKWINSRFSEKSACFGRSANEIFFSSDRVGSKGQLDLFYIYKNDRGYWEKPINLGDGINTEGVEDAPFFDPSSQSIYFSSDGHVGLGGFDIWESKYDSATSAWTPPKNVGIPINSTADDLYFNKDSNYVYFTSDRGDGLGSSDIYIGRPLDKEFQPRSLIGLAVFDAADSSYIDADIVARDNITNSILNVTPVSIGQFRMEIDLLPGDSVTFSVESDGFMYLIADRAINDDSRNMEFYMQRIEKNETYTLSHIFFEFNSAELSSESYFEIDKLESFLKRNPTLGIDIQGHTDDVGDDDYNLKLSQERAASVGTALQRRGIDPYRITTQGFGESQPLNTADNTANRRVEFSLFPLEGYN